VKVSDENIQSKVDGANPLLTASCCTALATLVPITLYQVGILPNLPDPPSNIFDSERITMSDAAHPLGVPDGLLGLASFGTTLALITLSKRSRLAKTLLGLKLSMDVSMATFNAGRQVFGFKKLCSWCSGTAIASGVMAYAGREVIRYAWSEVSHLAKDV
jgi:uncharacterized membrane protein